MHMHRKWESNIVPAEERKQRTMRRTFTWNTPEDGIRTVILCFPSQVCEPRARFLSIFIETQSTDTFGPSKNKSKRYIVSSEPYLYQDLEKVSKSLRDTQNPYNAMDISKKLSMDTDYQKVCQFIGIWMCHQKLINTNKAAIESYKVLTARSTLKRSQTVVNCLYQREILHTVTDDRTHDTYRNVISGYQLIRYLLDSHRCTTEDEVYYPSVRSFLFYRRSCSVNN